MKPKEREPIIRLCKQAVREKNPRRFMELLAKLNALEVISEPRLILSSPTLKHSEVRYKIYSKNRLRAATRVACAGHIRLSTRQRPIRREPTKTAEMMRR